MLKYNTKVKSRNYYVLLQANMNFYTYILAE